MIGKTVLAVLAVCLAVAIARPKGLKKERRDMILKSRNHGFEKTVQGDCPEGWSDGSSVGLGCVFADLGDADVNEPDAEVVCSGFGEGGRLVEIYNQDQMHFLQNMLGLIENESLGSMGGYIYWWIGLNDIEAADEFAWPSGNAVNYTNWDVDYNEPYPDPANEINCVQMQSAEFWSLLWMTYYCDDTDSLFPVCQIP
eukprot:TRINITY_DN1193_c0_g1_i2.p1 TRINITY_DN1193_c0_g1~~TRINITY_DN1193_c0_g1_i2.p1  ORF type:complete len:198 (-),score=66.71 TRINITY_DN1193_c0_g1_i2:246-839(-)